MKSSTILNETVGNLKCAIFAYDVSKDSLNFYSRIGTKTYERCFNNRSDIVETQLGMMVELAKKAGMEKILVVAESTGRYHEVLMRTARRLGLETAWVSGEAVAKMRVIETNDTGKTDIKDPHVIHTLAAIGKTLLHRVLAEPYNLLREWDGTYDAADGKLVAVKGELHNQLLVLFPDFGLSKDFFYGPSGQALVEKFGANPYSIVAKGQTEFAEMMRQMVPRIRKSSLEKLYRQAQSSVRHGLSERLVTLMEQRLRQLRDEYLLYEERKGEARRAMEQLYQEARQQDPNLPQEQKGVITTFYLARIIAETGPLSDFSSWRKLIRVAGLNLRERQSGTSRGNTKIYKKGRRGLRKVLSQAVLPLITHDGLYGQYYHHKKAATNMPGTKAMTIVMRKFLKMLFGWYRSGKEFDRKRVFTCADKYLKAA